MKGVFQLANENAKSTLTQVKFRLNEKEKEVWLEQANSLNMSLPKFTKYIMNSLIELGYVQPPKLDKQQAVKISKDLNKIGGNINQIAKWCNTNKHEFSENDALRMSYNLKQVQEELKEIWRQLN